MYSRLCYGKKNLPYNYSEFVCDTIDDIVNLPTNTTDGIANATNVIEPCSIGSKAIIVETKKVYILNNQNIWKEFLDYNSGNTTTNIDIATIEDLETYLEI